MTSLIIGQERTYLLASKTSKASSKLVVKLEKK
jgi:hypothetical protein